MRTKLTKTFIDNLDYDSAGAVEQVVWDTEIPQLGIRVYPSNKKSFVLYFRLPRGKRRKVLGAFGSLTLVQARQKAREFLSTVVDGLDPFIQKQAKANDPLFEELADAFIEKHAKRFKKTWKKDESRLSRLVLPAWGKLNVSSLTRDDVEELHGEITENSGPYAANRVLEIIRCMFNRADILGFNVEQNPAAKVRKNKERERHRYLSEEELKSLALSIEEDETPYKQLFKLYLLLGLRKNELLSLRWEHVNLKEGVIVIPGSHTKNGEAHRMPLSNNARETLFSLRKNSEWVFPSPKDSKRHIYDANRAWERIRVRAGLKDVRVHDLRRSFATNALRGGVPLYMVSQLLNHKSSRTTRVYAHYADTDKREALEVVSEKLAVLGGVR